VLWNQTHGATKLGLGASGVMKALPTGYQVGDFDYAGEHFDGFDILVTVWTEENVTLVAA